MRSLIIQIVAMVVFFFPLQRKIRITNDYKIIE